MSDPHEVDARRGTGGFAGDLAAWANSVRSGAPAYVGIARLVLDGNGIDKRFADAWAERVFPAPFDRPLLLFASLRHAALVEGAAHPLHAALVTAKQVDISGKELDEALARPELWRSLAHRHVQTNETSRAVAWRWPAFLGGCANAQRPLALFDLGASAGLNLVADALDDPWLDGQGRPLPCATSPDVILRRGFDARPIDVRDDDAALWLRACVWPGDTIREERLAQAIAAMREARKQVDKVGIETIDLAHAGARLIELSSNLPPRTLSLAYQSHVRAYLPAATLAAHRGQMDQWLSQSTAGSAVWIELEPVLEGGRSPHAELIAHVRDGGRVREILLATCPHHPRTIAIVDGAPEELARLLCP